MIYNTFISLSFLSTLFQSNKWDKIMSVLPSVAEALSIEILKSVVLNATQRDDWIETVIAVLAMTPAEKLSQLGADVSVVCSLLLTS